MIAIEGTGPANGWPIGRSTSMSAIRHTGNISSRTLNSPKMRELMELKRTGGLVDALLAD